MLSILNSAQAAVALGAADPTEDTEENDAHRPEATKQNVVLVVPPHFVGDANLDGRNVHSVHPAAANGTISDMSVRVKIVFDENTLLFFDHEHQKFNESTIIWPNENKAHLQVLEESCN